jgi:hypothetical protein
MDLGPSLSLSSGRVSRFHRNPYSKWRLMQGRAFVDSIIGFCYIHDSHLCESCAQNNSSISSNRSIAPTQPDALAREELVFVVDSWYVISRFSIIVSR